MREFKDIKARNCIKATIIENGVIEGHPILVIGRNSQKIYGVRISPKNKSKEKFTLCNNPDNSICRYYSLNNIYEIEEKDYQGYISTLSSVTYNEILTSMVRKKKYFEYIDFSASRINIDDDCVLYMDGKLYITIQRTSDKTYKIVKLKEDKKAIYGLKINGSKYVVDSDEIYEINIYGDEYFVIYHAQGITNNLIKNNDMKMSQKNKILHNFEFGDVIILKGNNEKVIYITEFNSFIYYVTFDQMELFMGFYKIEKSKVSGLYRKLDNSELENIATRIERPLTNDKYPIYNEIKSNVLDSIKSMRSNS